MDFSDKTPWGVYLTVEGMSKVLCTAAPGQMTPGCGTIGPCPARAGEGVEGRTAAAGGAVSMQRGAKLPVGRG